MSYMLRVGWRFVVITCSRCGALNPLPMLACLTEAEQLGCTDDEIFDEPPATVVDMAREAGLEAMFLDGMSVDGQPLGMSADGHPLLGVDLQLTSPATLAV